VSHVLSLIMISYVVSKTENFGVVLQ
jgi:hypothetical protein